MGHTNKYIAIRTMGLYFFQYIVIHGIFKKKSFYAYFIKENWDLCGIQCICEVVVHHFNDKYQEMQLELCFLWKKSVLYGKLGLPLKNYKPPSHNKIESINITS